MRDHLLQRVALDLRLLARAAPDLVEQLARRGRCFGHLIVEPVIGVSRKAKQFGPFAAQRNHLGDQRAVVGGAAVFAALDPGLEDFLAQVAAR